MMRSTGGEVPYEGTCLEMKVPVRTSVTIQREHVEIFRNETNWKTSFLGCSDSGVRRNNGVNWNRMVN